MSKEWVVSAEYDTKRHGDHELYDAVGRVSDSAGSGLGGSRIDMWHFPTEQEAKDAESRLKEAFPDIEVGVEESNLPDSDETRVICRECKAPLGIFVPVDDNGGVEMKCGNCGAVNYISNQALCYPEEWGTQLPDGTHEMTGGKPIGE